MARHIVRDDDITLPNAVLGRPFAKLCFKRLKRGGEAHKIGRGIGDAESRSVHDNGGFLRLGDKRRNPKCGRTEIDAGEEIDLLADDQLLSELLCALGIRTALVAPDDFDFLASDTVAMLADISLDPIANLLAKISELARKL